LIGFGRSWGFDVYEQGKNMRSITVSSKNALESAKNNGYEEIIVTGELAGKLKKGKKIAFASTVTIGILGAALAAIPFTGGLSGAVGLVPIAALTGFEIAAIIAAVSVGLTLIIAVFKDYEEISFDNGKMTLRKKKI
jgi:cation transporter-like permease